MAIVLLFCKSLANTFTNSIYQHTQHLYGGAFKSMQHDSCSVAPCVHVHSFQAPQESCQAQDKGIMCCCPMQAYAKLSEPTVIVKVREADQSLAKEAIEAAKSKFKDAFGKDAPSASLDTKNFLPAAGDGKEGEEENSW